MIIPEHLLQYRRLAPFVQPDMLILGNQTNKCKEAITIPYKTLDPDGGDIQVDLQDAAACAPHREQWQTVFNIGTLEHIWDAHAAYRHSADMVRLGGCFLGMVPVAGWEQHGIHITDWRYVLKFYEINGFSLESYWWTSAHGSDVTAPQRNAGKSILLWFAARRYRNALLWVRPSQVYRDGNKPT